MFAVTWILLLVIYFLFVGQFSVEEAVAGIVVGGLCALYARRVRRSARRPYAFAGVPWLTLLGRLSLALARDTAAVGATLARAVVRGAGQGTQERRAFNPGNDAASASGRRGIVILAASLAPNAYVLAVEPDLRLHRLSEGGAKAAADTKWPI